MTVDGKIVKILPARSGSNERGDYCFQPIVLEMCEPRQRQDGTTYIKEHTFCIDICGSLARNFTLPVGTEIAIDLHFTSHVYNGKDYQSIRSSYFYVKAASL